MADRDETPIHAALAAARLAPIPAGARSATLMRHGSMTLRYYAPAGEDRQTPHDQDEIYLVISGEGWFVVDGERRRFAAGDALFAAAGSAHCFEEFSAGFATWVVFYGPKGGEAAA